jgi:DNA-binding transcriptional regulator YbjK
MSERAPAVRDRLTPNQLDKQRQIVEAAMRVLATRGLAACTAREVAAAGPLTKSAIHYYFADLDELIDEAMAGHIAAFLERVRAAAGDGFWAAIEAYLGAFEENPAAALLWYDYWIASARAGRLEPIERMNREVIAVLAGLLDAPERAEAVFSVLLGLVVQQSVRRRPFAEIKAQIELGAGLPAR